MNHTAPSTVDKPDTLRALSRAIGLSAFVYGYPLVETYRTCRKQTDTSGERPSISSGSDARLPMNTLHHGRRPSTHEDRDVVTPANDLLYTLAWIHLADGPMLMTLPSSRKHAGRYYVMALYDAYTENFENLGPRTVNADGETVLLLGPNGSVPDELKHCRAVQCPSNLVWLIGRTLVGDQNDWHAARALQADVTLKPAFVGDTQALPAAVRHWMGDPVDAMALAHEQKLPAVQVAPAFFTNFCQSLAEAPGRVEDMGLVAWFAQAGLVASKEFSWDALEEPVRQGLIEGFEDAVALVGTVGGRRRPRPWTFTGATGRYGNKYLNRARTAYLGLGALATTEAIYAASHCDASLQALNGEQAYQVKFSADSMPPVDAFWSVTMYDADRFLYGNEINRYSIGDRTPGLEYESDGSLVLRIGSTRPVNVSNWLPAPAGPFYLILRMYHPQDGVRNWTIPSLEIIV